MAELIITTYFWGKKYGPDYVAKIAGAVKRGLRQSYRFVVITDDVTQKGVSALVGNSVHSVFPIAAADQYLTKVQGCFVRLRMFDPTWQAMHGINEGDRIVSLDLDAVITGSLDALFDRPESFVILQGANAANPCPFNGSIFMLRAGEHANVWTDFSLEAANATPFYSFPDDQGWFHHKMPAAAGWQVGQPSGIYAFCKPGWPKGEALPAGARLVAFPGWRDPAKFAHLDWIKTHWRA
jgi:hypothetical protein